jgi:optic atrophy 3 protein
MRVSVASLRDVAAEKRAKEKAEAPTVKTEEEVKAEAEKAAKLGTIITSKSGITITKEPKRISHEAGKSVWTRTFRPLPEAKAVDLFADVIGDTFILLVAGGLITYEYIKAKQKPDHIAERLDELAQQLKEEERKIAELEESEKEHKHRVEVLEQALELLRNEKAPGRMKRALSMS